MTYIVENCIDGSWTADEFDTLEEAIGFAGENGGTVMPASEYRPRGHFDDWWWKTAPEDDDFGVRPGIDYPATLCPAF